MPEQKIYQRLPDGTLNPAWTQARLGRITASEIHRIMTGDAARATYLLEKLTERVERDMVGKGLSGPMEDGIALEPEAGAAYEEETGEKLVIGHLMEGPGFLATPDYLVVSGGLVECKAPIVKTALGERFGHLLREKAKRKRGEDGKLVEAEVGAPPNDYYWQCVAQCIAADEPWCDLYYYVPGLRPVALQGWLRRIWLETDVERKLLDAVAIANEMLDAAYDAVTFSRSGEVVAKVVEQIEAAGSHEAVDRALYSVEGMRLPAAAVKVLDEAARRKTLALPAGLEG